MYILYIYIYTYTFLSSVSDTAQVSQVLHSFFTMFPPFCEFQVQGAPKLPSLEVEEAKPKAG